MSSIDLWKKQVSVKENQEYIEQLLRKFKINKFNLTYNGYLDYDLFVTYNNIEYKLAIDEIDRCVKIFKKNLSGNKKRKEYYHVFKSIYGVDVWYEALKYITRG